MEKENTPSIISIIDFAIIQISIFGYSYINNGFLSVPHWGTLMVVFISIIWFVIVINSNISHVNGQTLLFESLKKLWIGYSVLTVNIIVFVAVFSDFKIHHKWILYALLTAIVTSSVFRVLYIICIKHFVKNGYQQKNILLIGSGHMAEHVMKQIIHFPEYGYRLYGILADQFHESLPKGLHLGKLERLSEIVQSKQVDEVIIALPTNEEKKIIDVIETCEHEGIRPLIVPHFFMLIKNRLSFCEIGNIPLVSIRTEPLEILRHRFIKRSFDILFSLMALTILSPVFLAIAIIIKATSRGPVFFAQNRIGVNNVEFNMYKFRSMVVQDVEKSDTIWTSENDPRVTKIGKFLRKTNLDELPQFFNVLRGEMSIVGPRPERHHFVEQFKNDIPSYKVRHFVKSGITGWAQVNGYRGDTSIEKRVEHDIFYIENWTLLTDIKIIFLTVFGRKTQRNAY